MTRIELRKEKMRSGWAIQYNKSRYVFPPMKKEVGFDSMLSAISHAIENLVWFADMHDGIRKDVQRRNRMLNRRADREIQRRRKASKKAA